MEQIIIIGDFKIFVKIEGEGPPILLLHSYWGSQFLFDRLTGQLSVDHKVIRIDLPGHGKSGPPPEGYRFDLFAKVLNEILEIIQVKEQIAIIGHSMGGYAGLAFSAWYPEKTASLVLMHSPVQNSDDQSIRQRNREAKLLISGKKDLLLQVTIPSNFAPGNDGNMVEEIILLNKAASEVTLPGALRSIEAMNKRNNYLGNLKEAGYPVLIIIGKHDKVYGFESQLADSVLIPSAEVLLLDHSGHLGFMEEYDLVLSALMRFLRRQIS